MADAQTPPAGETPPSKMANGKGPAPDPGLPSSVQNLLQMFTSLPPDRQQAIMKKLHTLTPEQVENLGREAREEPPAAGSVPQRAPTKAPPQRVQAEEAASPAADNETWDAVNDVGVGIYNLVAKAGVEGLRLSADADGWTVTIVAGKNRITYRGAPDQLGSSLSAALGELSGA